MSLYITQHYITWQCKLFVLLKDILTAPWWSWENNEQTIDFHNKNVGKKNSGNVHKVDKKIFNDLLLVLGNIENDFKKQKIEEIISKFLTEKGLKLSDIIQYIRAMITGLDVSPRIYDIMEILGFIEIKKRIENFING